MQTDIETYEGSWEEIALLASGFARRRLRVTILPASPNSAVDASPPKFGDPTPLATRLKDELEALKSLPPAATEEIAAQQREIKELLHNVDRHRKDTLRRSTNAARQLTGNANLIETETWSNPDSERLYMSIWHNESEVAELYRAGRQCGACSFYAKFNANYGLCCNPESRHELETVVEHFTCSNHELEA